MVTDKENPFEILYEDPNDEDVAKQFSALLNWKIVSSRSDKHPECGYPLGDVLCRSLEEAQKYIEDSKFTDCYVRDYGEF